MTEERLRDFAAAWARGDIDELMSFMSDDCIYEASVGPEPGKTFKGPAAVRKGFQEMLAYDADGESHGGPIFICGDKGVTEWSYIQKTANGQHVEVRGCDIMEFEGDKIRRKNAFRKTRG